MRLAGAARPVWEAKERHPGGVTALAVGRAATGGPLLAWGGRDGAVRLCSAGRGTLLQTLDTAQYSRGERPKGNSAWPRVVGDGKLVFRSLGQRCVSMSMPLCNARAFKVLHGSQLAGVLPSYLAMFAGMSCCHVRAGRGFFADALQHHRHEITGAVPVKALVDCGLFHSTLQQRTCAPARLFGALR